MLDWAQVRYFCDMESYFVTGIGTDVGKTVVAAILTQALEADYWKPIQAGDLNYGDTKRVMDYVSNTKTVYHDNAFALTQPMSPHAAAQIDQVKILAKNIVRPTTKNDLVIEGAGGLLVPINSTQTIADLILPSDRVIVVSRHYLGSINHSLLTLEVLKQRGITPFGIVFSGNEHPSTEAVILAMSGAPMLGRINNEPYIDKNVVLEYAELFKPALQ